MCPTTAAPSLPTNRARCLSVSSWVRRLSRLGKALHWRPLPLTVKEGLRFSRPWLQEQKIHAHAQVRQSNGQKASRGPRPYLQVEKLSVRYGERTVVRNVDLAVWPGETVVLMGRNGAGKTTVLRTLVGLVKPQAGAIRVAGDSIAGKDVDEICRKVGYLPQDPNTLLFADTVRDELFVTLRNHGMVQNGSQGNSEGTPTAGADPDELLSRLRLSGKARRVSARP